MEKLKRIFALLIAVSMLFSLGLTGYAEDIAPSEETTSETEPAFYDGYELFEYLYNFLKDNHYTGPEEEEILLNTIKKMLEEHPELLDDFIKALMKSQDKYSYYFSAEEYDDYKMSDTYYGIGITVAYHKGYLSVDDVTSGSPASEAGVEVGDIVYSVDGKLVAGLEQEDVSALIRGEKDTEITVEFYRPGDGTLFSCHMIREKLKGDPVSWEYFEDEKGTYAVCKITSFTGYSVYYKFLNFIFSLRDTGVDRVVFDVRDNPGGDLTVALDIINWLLPDKGSPICSTAYANKDNNFTYRTTGRGISLNKIAVLVNENTASAAELFAKVLQEYDLAYIVGQTTHGKAIGQIHYLQTDGSVISLSSFELISPKGEKYNEIGVIPDLITEKPYDILPQRTWEPLNHNNYISAKMYSDNNVNYALEQRLVLLGFLDGADSVFDKDTVSAIWAFQSATGINPTGTFNLETLKKMTSVVNLVKLLAEEKNPQLEGSISYVLK